MTANKLQEAITRIRAGDKRAGQKLLTEVLDSDPANVTAWLWMAAVQTGEKRRFCLEKILSIDPNHPQAREQLARLSPSAPPAAPVKSPSPVQSVQADVPTAPVLAPAAVRTPVQGKPLPKVWLSSGKYLSHIIYLEGTNLLTFAVLARKALEVLNEVRLGVTPKQFEPLKSKFHLLNVGHISLAKAASVTLFGNVLKVTGVDKSGREKKISTTVNRENAEAVLKALHERLGAGFERSVRPVSRLKVMSSGLVLFVLTFFGTGFFYWLWRRMEAAVEAEGQAGGGAPTGGIAAALLLLIGPNDVLWIGGLLLAIAIIAMLVAFTKPTEETVLAPGAEMETSR